jgi:hypothetical protein
MSAEFPNSQLIGIDLHYQLPMSVVPPNCQFMEMDLCQG